MNISIFKTVPSKIQVKSSRSFKVLKPVSIFTENTPHIENLLQRVIKNSVLFNYYVIDTFLLVLKVNEIPYGIQDELYPS